MSGSPQAVSTEHAVALEQAGRLDEAARMYLALGAIEAAARVLAKVGRFDDASRLLLSLAGSEPMRDQESRRLTHHAATCLAHAGDRHGSAALFRAIGDEARAARVLGLPPPGAGQSFGPPSAPASAPMSTPPTSDARPDALGRAAYQARAAGRVAEAASLYLRAGLAFEAGVCFMELGDTAAALVQLVTVAQTGARYRQACVRVAHIVAQSGALSFEVDNFVAAFARTDPTTPHEIVALYQLGVLYQTNRFDDEAREVFERVLRASPGYGDVESRLAALGGSNAGGNYAALAEQDLSFWQPARRTVPDVEEGLSVAVHATGVVESATSGSGPRVAQAALATLTKGAMVGARYRIESELGRGGMGVVYAAHDGELGELVALKAFTQRVDDPTLVARFKQELTLTRQLSHENVIRVYDMGVHDGCRFITMELLRGVSLKEKIAGLSIDAALGYLHQVAKGLEAIHARGVIHRDIKSANVFVTASEIVKIMDFGLAKKGGVADGITASGFMAGTPGYMPPEQVTGFGTVTPAADMYALGVVAYELVSGARPFRHKDPSQVFRLQFTTEPVPLGSVVASTPPELDVLVLGLLDRDPTKRPTAAATRIALEQIAPRTVTLETPRR